LEAVEGFIYSPNVGINAETQGFS